MPVLIVVLYVVAELAAVIWVGSAIGVLATLGLLILGSVLGGALLRHEGRRTMQALRASQGTRTSPATELADGALLGVGAFLLLIPGFVSDLLGMLLILPPTRALLRPVVKASAARRVQVVGSTLWTRSGRGQVIDGEVIDAKPSSPRSSKLGLRGAPEPPFGRSRP